MKKTIAVFFKSEIAVGIGLTIATIAALMTANSSSYQLYHDFFEIAAPLNLDFINIQKDLTLRDWINDFLMAIFFLLVGLELKREILVGELSSKSKIILPIIAACGGVIGPMLIFIFFNQHSAENMRGFAIPCATDIAFAYGLISLFGKFFSNSLKVFIVSLAVIDDLIAILLIAFFYTDGLDASYLLLALVVMILLGLLNFFRVNKISFYLFLGSMLWLMILKSGIHATLAGVILAMFIPLRIRNEGLLSKLAHQIAPTVNFLILPIFAFANAGVHIENFSYELLLQPIVMGIALGLFFGKQIGVMLSSFVAIKLRISSLPHGTSWSEFYAASIFTAIGFTMSLFISSLSYATNLNFFDEAKIGVLLGSFIAVIWGGLVVFFISFLNKIKIRH